MDKAKPTRRTSGRRDAPKAAPREQARAKALAAATSAPAGEPRTARPRRANAAPATARTAGRSLYTPEEIEAIFAALAEAMPEPKSELEFHNPFTLLVAVVLSAQATDVGVNKATRELFRVADTPQKMVALGEERLRGMIRSLGFFNTKAKNVIALAEALIARHGGEVPAARAALEALPGVGRKTANVVLNVAFGQPTIAVDTHVFRVCNRIGLAPGATPAEVETELMRIVPERFLRDAHHWLILHGRHTCKARRPLCERCVIYDLCKSPEKRVIAA